jgi:peroxiredoxin
VDLDPRFALPNGLPVPVDDGAADHLVGARLPEIALASTDGGEVLLSELDRAVVFMYPRTGTPSEPNDASWDAIPGARGCTPQSCGFRDLRAEFATLGVRVFGLSTQTTAYQREMVERLHLGIPVLSDSELRLVRALRLPTFEFDSGSVLWSGGRDGPRALLKRMAWYVEGGVIERVWYPVFPPDRNAGEVLAWLRERGA